jgi:2',3'-cyclic-nucleotide 2'-phosphodiesterase/3'-nucleotidase
MSKLRLLLAAVLLASLASAKEITVTLLATTDVHGNIYPVDYFSGQPAERGLAKIATLIRAARQENPNSLLIDCGDSIEGTPLESLYQRYVNTGRLPEGLQPGAGLAHDPMMLAMNQLGYRAMVMGNHEFNFGLKSIERARADAHFPWLSANTQVQPGARLKPFAPYIVEKVAGVKIAVIGVTPAGIPIWEQPDHYAGCTFVDGRDAVAQAVAKLQRKEKPDIIVAAVHEGFSNSPQNLVRRVAMVPGIDAIVFGHSHQQEPGAHVGNVLLVQPKNWGISLARVDFKLEQEGRRWKITSKNSRLIPVTKETEADPAILAIARPYHELTEKYLDMPVAESPVDMEGTLGRVEDSPLVDAIQQVQMFYAKADVSFTALFNTRVRVPKGPVTVRQIAALYVYDNELFAIEGNGKMVKDALENAARYYQTCPDAACSHGPLINTRVIGYNYDMAEGVEYEIDLTKPAGQRIVNLRRNGKPLDPNEPLRIAVNNYRAGGSGGYQMFRDAKVLWRSPHDLRSLIVEYFADHKTLPARADGNWRVLPPGALKVLEKEAAAEASRNVDR